MTLKGNIKLDLSRSTQCSSAKAKILNATNVNSSIRVSKNSTDTLVVVIDSLETEYDSVDESSVCSTFFPSLEKPGDAKIISEPKAIKTTLKSISTFKAEALKGIIHSEPSLALAQENKQASALKSNSAPAKNPKNVKSINYHYFPTVIKELNDLKLQDKNVSASLKSREIFFKIKKSYTIKTLLSTLHSQWLISLERAINPRNPQRPFKRCEVCGSSIHTTTNHYDIEWFKREKLVAFKAPRTSSQTKKKVSRGTNPRAKAGHKKQSTSFKQPFMSSNEATKVGGPTSLGVTSEEGAHLQLSSGYVASANSTIEAGPRTSALNDYLPPQQGKDKGTKNYSLDHIFADLAKLVLKVKADFKDLDSLEDDPIIVVDDSEEGEEENKNEEIHSVVNDKTKDILASIPPFPSHYREGEQQTQVTREKTDEECTEAENNKERAEIQDTNILSQGLPRHIFNILNQTETAKDIWENVELLMQGFGLTEQKQKETLFDQYERFWANGNELIHDYFV
nr:hypothetical protein [Tanacetum cinerariifolium]